MDVYFAALKFEAVVQTPDYDLPAFLSGSFFLLCSVLLLRVVQG